MRGWVEGGGRWARRRRATTGGPTHAALSRLAIPLVRTGRAPAVDDRSLLAESPAPRSTRTPASARPHARRLTTIPLAALIFYEVSGGPFGVEDAVGAGGPLLAIAGFCLLPLVWSVPEALVTAELATAFPEDAGFVAWVTAAFGPGWGFQEGFWSWASGVADNAIYPHLFASYVDAAAPGALAGWRRPALTVSLSLAGAWVNYLGLGVVGPAAVAAAAAVAAPFAVLVGLAAPRVQPSRWAAHPPWGEVKWGALLNVLFWNLNYWDSVSTLAGEVSRPATTLPRALALAVAFVVAMYVLPLAAATGVLPAGAGKDWSLGYFAAVGKAVGGAWLSWWIVGAAAVSAAGQFEAEMSSDAFLLLGMAQRGFLPARLAARSKHGSPGLAIALSSVGILLLVPLSFLEIVDLLNAIYCLAQLLEFAAFIALRVRAPHLARPFRVPLGTVGCVLMLLPATLLLAALFILPAIERNWTMLAWTAGAVVTGLALQALINMARARGWCAFVGAAPHDFRELLAAEASGLAPGARVTPAPAPEVDASGEVVDDGGHEFESLIDGGAGVGLDAGLTRRPQRAGGGAGGGVASRV